nr:[protein-PII] uridylyltransferase [Acidimicrobiia bacterium]
IAWDRVTPHIDAALDQRLAIEARLAERTRTYQRRTPVPRLPPPSVRFDDGASATATVIEVQAPDRVGLLYWVTRAFAEFDLDVRVAKVQTLGDVVIDSFYVTHLDGSLVTAGEVRSELERALLHAVR